MLRRVVTQLLIPLLVLPCFAHAHARANAHDPSGQDRSPHIHFRFFSCSSQRPPHDLHHCGHPGNDERMAFAGKYASPDHDDDAVYLSVSALFGWCCDSTVVPLDPRAHVTWAGAISFADTALYSLPSQPHWTLPVQGRPCPIYLSSLTLLI